MSFVLLYIEQNKTIYIEKHVHVANIETRETSPQKQSIFSNGSALCQSAFVSPNFLFRFQGSNEFSIFSCRIDICFYKSESSLSFTTVWH